MNDNTPQPWIDPALEARIVASILGETSSFEAAELERLLAEDPELALFKRRIEAVHNLVGEAIRPENPKIQLSPDRRKKLQETIGIPALVPDKKIRTFPPRRPAWWSPQVLLRIAACLILTTMVLAIVSQVSLFRNSAELFTSEGYTGERGFAVNADQPQGRAAGPSAADDSSPGASLAGGERPPASTVDDLTSNKSNSDRSVKPSEGVFVSTGVVTAVQPDFSSPQNQPREFAALKQELLNKRQEQLAQADQQVKVGKDLEISQARARRNSMAGETDTKQLSSSEEKLQQLPEHSAKLVNALQAQLSAPQSQTDAAGSAVGTAASDYLNGAPDNAPAPSGNLASGWDSLYMFRGVNVLGQNPAEAKPLPAEVVNEITKSVTEANAPLTAGNRSASTAISANSVDALRAFSDGEGIAPSAQVTVWDGQTSASGHLVAETTVAKNKTDGRDGTLLPSVPEQSLKELTKTDTDQPVFAQASKEVAPALGDVPLSRQIVRDESRTDAPPSPQTANIINQPVFSTREDGKVEFDGFVNYGSPIATESNLERKVSQTKYLLEEGQEFSESGRYDLAFKRYEQALEIDPYNIAARRGMENVNEARTKYAASAYNEVRRNLVRSVDNGWSLPVRKFDIGSTTIITQLQLDQTGPALINRKLDEIVIPRVDFQDVTIREALDFLKQRAYALDGSETDAAKKGVNIVLNLPENTPESEARITLGLTDIPLRAAINYVANAANLKLKIEPYAVSVVPLSASTEVLVTKEYKVPPNFLPPAPKSDATPLLGAGTPTSPGSLPKVSARSGAREYLESLGITFPPGATTYFIASSNKLIVKNTASNLELVDTLVENQIGRDGSPSRPSTAVSSKPPYQTNETLTAKKPASTFSLHVSDVSFQLARDALAKGTLPDPARIRPEEFYNVFDYNDPSPAPGEPVTARIEQAAHPFLQQRNLVRIAVKAAASGRAAGQPLRLTILLDTSGSMEREDRAVSVRQALQTLTTLLGPNDRVTLIGFARTPRLLAEQIPGDQAGKIVEAADRTPSEGGTNLEEALALASEMALKQKLPAAQNRIVLLTDGAANLGNADPVRLGRQIEKTRQQGISFDACGVGAIGLNDEILETLTRKGDGRYYFLNKPGDADASFARQLAGAFRPAAENVKVQVVFNPARVAKYRLLGFEEHLLKREDFRNDKVQAAELSAEEAGVALYQVEPLPEGEGDLGQVFVRFRDPATGTMVERSWTMPYEAQPRSFDQASPSLQLAATAALLAERLQGNPQIDLSALKPTLTSLRSHYPHQTRVRELLQMFDQVQR